MMSRTEFVEGLRRVTEGVLAHFSFVQFEFLLSGNG